MKKLLSVVLAAAAFFSAVADEAWAGQIQASGGPIQVNNQTVAPGQTVPVRKGDVVKTGDASAIVKSDAGDEIRLDRGTTMRHDGVQDGTEYFLIGEGSASGNLSTRTTIGTATAWATAPEGQRAEVRVEAPMGRHDKEGRFRATKGGSWLRVNEYSMWLPEAHSITLWREDGKPGFLFFRTSQQNEGVVEIRRAVSGGTIRVRVPRAVSGYIQDMGTKTKIANDVTSNKQQKIDIATEFGTQSAAQIGPGAYAIIDNQTGGIELGQEMLEDNLDDFPYDPVDDAADASLQRRTKR